MGLSYRESGVDIEEGDRLVELIEPHARSTLRPEVLGGIGGFGGLFALDLAKYRQPVLVSGTDGVGTKLKLAFEMQRHETVGVDLVAMCVNDIAVVGAEPLFFLDYYATGRLAAEDAAAVVAGIAEGCRQAGCALIGGETAELPGFYPHGEYDLAGFAVGCVERSKMVDGQGVREGDVVLGLASSGLHSNGFSLVRKALGHLPLAQPLSSFGPAPLGEVLLAPTRIYARAILDLLGSTKVKAMAHITGGGLPGNVPRTLPKGVKAVLHERSWPRPPVFDLVAREGGVERQEMYRAFNMGLGMVLVLEPGAEREAMATFAKHEIPSFIVGSIEPSALGEATCEVLE